LALGPPVSFLENFDIEPSPASQGNHVFAIAVNVARQLREHQVVPLECPETKAL